jgi:RNA polymerase sigma factor (sigma-70 family)
MSDAARPVRVADLLAHREWVSRVARALVRDADTAADLEQDLWVETLERPPVVRTSLRGWLATALRRDVLSLRRGAARRTRRETAAARPEAQSSTDEIVARAEAADRVMHAVLELAEPYRSTILLRYVEGVELADIAAQAGVPVETVRTRHKRALATLRERLGGGSDGDAWLAALAPLVDLRRHVGSGAAATAVAGGTIMASKATVAAGVGLALVAGFGGGQLSAATDERPRARVAELVRRVDALDATHASAPTPTPTRRSPSGDDRRAARDRRLDAIESDLDAALARPAASDVERARLTALSTEELLVEAKQLVKVAKYTKTIVDGDAVLSACAILLARRLSSDERAQALICQGQGNAVLGDATKEEASFREALKVAGDSSQAEDAMIELAYMEGRRGGFAAAAEWWRRVADWHADAARRATAAAERAHHRYYMAIYLGRANETARAREEHQAVVNEFGASDDKDVRKWADFSRKEIEKLDGKTETSSPKAPPPGRKNGAR